MGILLSELVQKATVKDSMGNPVMLVNGDETLEDLRDLIIQLTDKCPLGKSHFSCPFRMLSGLTPGSINRTVQSMSRESCLQLFVMELECRTAHADNCHSRSRPA